MPLKRKKTRSRLSNGEKLVSEKAISPMVANLCDGRDC